MTKEGEISWLVDGNPQAYRTMFLNICASNFTLLQHMLDACTAGFGQMDENQFTIIINFVVAVEVINRRSDVGGK